MRLKTRVTAIEKSGDGLVHASSNGKDEVFKADLVVHAAGRVPELDPLDLAAAGVASEKGRLRLNEFLQSVSNPAVYAVGDAALSGPPLTPVASHDAKAATANMLNGNHEKPNYLGVPSVAFTIPPIASVGLSEKQAREIPEAMPGSELVIIPSAAHLSSVEQPQAFNAALLGFLERAAK